MIKTKLIDFKGLQVVEEENMYASAQKSCKNDSCVKKNVNYENGYFTWYDIITRGFDNYIPGLFSLFSKITEQFRCGDTKRL